MTDLFLIIDNTIFKGEFALSILWTCLFCWFLLPTAFSYYIPVAFSTKHLLVCNVLLCFLKNMNLDRLIRLVMFFCANEKGPCPIWRHIYHYALMHEAFRVIWYRSHNLQNVCEKHPWRSVTFSNLKKAGCRYATPGYNGLILTQYSTFIIQKDWNSDQIYVLDRVI